MSIRLNKIRLNTGISLNYVESGNPDGNPVLFIHGFPDSWNSFRLVLNRLDPKFHAFSVDLRGFGDSDRPASGYTITDFAKDAVEFLDSLKLKKTVIVGHSMGSFIAQTIALRFPERVDKLVLIGSAASAWKNPVIDEVLSEVNKLKDPIDKDFVTEFQKGTIHGDVSVDFFNSVISESLKAPAFVWKQSLTGLAYENHQNELGGIKQPALIVWGAYDSIFTMGDQTNLLSALPRAALKVYKNSGHSPNWDNAVELTKDLEEFF